MHTFYQMFPEKADSPRMSIGERGFRIEKIYDCNMSAEDLIPFLPMIGGPYPAYGFEAFTLTELRTEPISGTEKSTRVSLVFDAVFDMSMTPSREQWTFTMRAGTEKVKSVLNSTYTATVGIDEEDPGTAINVDQRGDVQGADVYKPKFAIHVSKVWSHLTPANLAFLADMQGTINNDTWMGFAPGMVLCIGTEVSQTPQGFAKVEYDFLVAPYITWYSTQALNGETLTLPILSGWDYVWARFGQDAYGNRGITRIVVDQVYEYANFGVFGLVGPYEPNGVIGGGPTGYPAVPAAINWSM